MLPLNALGGGLPLTDSYRTPTARRPSILCAEIRPAQKMPISAYFLCNATGRGFVQDGEFLCKRDFMCKARPVQKMLS
jgi:hypothetical protein